MARHGLRKLDMMMMMMTMMMMMMMMMMMVMMMMYSTTTSESQVSVRFDLRSVILQIIKLLIKITFVLLRKPLRKENFEEN